MGYAYTLLAALLWATIGAITRVAFRAGLWPMEIAFWRAALASLLFVAHAFHRRSLRVESRDLPALVAFGVVGIAGLYASFQLAVHASGAALAAVLMYTAPAWVALLSWPLFRRRPSARETLAVVLTAAGVAAVVLGAGRVHVNARGVFWGLCAGLSYASFYLFGQRYFARYATETVFAWSLPVGALAMLPAVTFHRPGALGWIMLATLALVCTYGASLAYGAAVRRLPAVRVAVVATVEPVAGALIAFVGWGERFGAAGYVGAAGVVAGVLLIATERRAAEG